jgi:biotin carboxylase
MTETVLLIGSGYRHFREYVLRGLAADFQVVMITGAAPDWQLPYLAQHRVVDLGDEQAVFAAAAALAEAHPLAGVLTWEDASVVRAAALAERCGTPSMPPHAARACRDKALQRELLAAARVPSARYEIGLPVVLKPRGRAASTAVRIARSEAEIREAFALVRRAENPSIEDGRVLVEEFLDGPEISVDAWVLDGRVEPFAVAAKRTDYPPYFEEVAHVVGPVLAAPAENTVRDVVAAANRALGTDRTITHTELMLTAEGPKVVEVNGRLGGGLIPHLAELASPGLSVGRMLGAVATGREPAPAPAPERLFGIRFLYPEDDLEFDGLEVPAALAAEPWLHTVRRVSEPGTQLRLPPRQFLGRAGYVIATGENVAEVDSRLQKAAEAVVLRGVPLLPATNGAS